MTHSNSLYNTVSQELFQRDMRYPVQLTEERSLNICVTDGMGLDARLILPRWEPRGMIMMNGGTGIPKEFYRKFAIFLAENGYGVLLYDYRGIGGSRPHHLSGFEAKLHHWGSRDMVGILDWLEEEFPSLPKFAIGHSMGGQLLGFMENHDLLDGVITIASSTGYWRKLGLKTSLLSAFMWYAYVPLSTKMWGYVPAKAIGQGEDLAAGIAKEWASWCKNPRYFQDFIESGEVSQYYGELRSSFHAYVFDDDPIASYETASDLLRHYTGTEIQFKLVQAERFGMKQIGHFGFFSSRSKQKLWPLMLQSLGEMLKG